MFIKKYKLISKFSEENEFETSKKRITTTTMVTKTKTDDEGNVLSVSEVFVPSWKTNIIEEITAVSLPSRTPAEVQIIEIINDENEAPIAENQTPKEQGPKIMQGPIRPRPVTLDQLNGGRGIAKPMVIKTDPEITKWVN